MTYKPLDQMTLRELKQDLSELRWHIKHYASGTWEFRHERELLEEIERRRQLAT